MAAGHSMVVIFYCMLKEGRTYAERGGDFFDRMEPERLTCYYLKRVAAVGHKVALEMLVPA